MIYANNLFLAIKTLSKLQCFQSFSTLRMQRNVCSEIGMGKQQLLKTFCLKQTLVFIEDNISDEASHGPINVDFGTVVSLDRSNEHILVLDSLQKNRLDVFRRWLVELGDIVLISDGVHTDWNQNALALVVACKCGDLVFVVCTGVNELKKELKVLWIVFM